MSEYLQSYVSAHGLQMGQAGAPFHLGPPATVPLLPPCCKAWMPTDLWRSWDLQHVRHILSYWAPTLPQRRRVCNTLDLQVVFQPAVDTVWTHLISLAQMGFGSLGTVWDCPKSQILLLATPLFFSGAFLWAEHTSSIRAVKDKKHLEREMQDNQPQGFRIKPLHSSFQVINLCSVLI